MKSRNAKRNAIMALLIALLAGAAQAQQIYRWVDANGRVQYSAEKPPAGAASSLVQPRVSSVGGNAAAGPKSPAARGDRTAGRPAVKMYATDWCPYCKQAREYFARNGIPYVELDIEKSETAKAEHKSIGGRGIPVILVGGERMNGFSEQRMALMLKAAGY
jgi:glutaredoxin